MSITQRFENGTFIIEGIDNMTTPPSQSRPYIIVRNGATIGVLLEDGVMPLTNTQNPKPNFWWLLNNQRARWLNWQRLAQLYVAINSLLDAGNFQASAMQVWNLYDSTIVALLSDRLRFFSIGSNGDTLLLGEYPTQSVALTVIVEDEMFVIRCDGKRYLVYADNQGVKPAIFVY